MGDIVRYDLIPPLGLDSEERGTGEVPGTLETEGVGTVPGGPRRVSGFSKNDVGGPPQIPPVSNGPERRKFYSEY